MSFMSIVYGRIISGSSFSENINVINSLDTDQAFPWILKEMFSWNALKYPYYFDSPIITFGATYKQVEDDLTAWLIKFESILNKLDFETAKIDIETEIYGTYHFFWKSKKHNLGNNDKYYEEMGLKAHEMFYYGYGKRDMWGNMEDADNDEETRLVEIHNLQHPFKLTEASKLLIKDLYDLVGLEKLTYFYDLPGNFIEKQDILFPLLTKLATENKIILKTNNFHELNKNEKFGPYFILKV